MHQACKAHVKRAGERASSFTEFFKHVLGEHVGSREHGRRRGYKETLAQEPTDTHEDDDTQVDFVAVKASPCVQSGEGDHIMDTWGTRFCFAAITGQSLAAFPPKPAPSVIQTALHVLWIGAQHQSGEMR